jgi:hypothetical protein
MRKPVRRVLIAVLIATGPVFTACQAVLDFDRSPFQIDYEAGPPQEDSGSGGGTDAGTDRGEPPSEGGRPEAGVEAGPAPVDSGGDARDAQGS